MLNKVTTLAIGSPQFANVKLAAMASQSGAAAAWHSIAESDPVSALSQVSGDFAVGVRSTSGRTLLAVDRFAIHSLCYRIVGTELRFAARADELADPSTDIDPQAILDYLFFHTIPSPRTVFSGVFRLPPAHYALFENGNLTVAPYWIPRFEEVRNPNFDELKSEFLDILRSSVATQLNHDKPACFLSGGTDSSTVAGMMAAIGKQPPSSYSIGFDAAGYDEMSYARIAAKRFHTDHHEYYVTPNDLVKSIGKVASHYDQPFGNSSALPAYYCALMAKNDGVTKILAGDGGDELFGGNTRYALQRIFGWYAMVPEAVRTRMMEPFFGASIIKKMPLLKKGSGYIEQARVPMPDRIHMYNLMHRLGMGNILTPAFLSLVDTKAPVAQLGLAWEMPQTDNALNRNLSFDWRYTLAENDLPKVCGTAKLAGLEVGFPFLDQRLLDFSLRLPASYKLKGFKLRWFFKEALRGLLPNEIITKKKHGFGLPFGVWATHHPALRTLAVDSLNQLADRGVIRRDFIEELLERHLPTHPGYYGEMVWILMMLEQWLQAHAPAYRIV